MILWAAAVIGVMADAVVVEWVRKKYQGLEGSLNERSRRLWAATEARSVGDGGIAAVLTAIGMSSATVAKGLRELDAQESGDPALPGDRIRRAGGGRKRARHKQPGLAAALRGLLEPTARGDPMQLLRGGNEKNHPPTTTNDNDHTTIPPL